VGERERRIGRRELEIRIVEMERELDEFVLRIIRDYWGV